MNEMNGHKLCGFCGQPMLKKNQRRKHPDDYRHAQGCPYDRSKPKQKGTKCRIEDCEKKVKALKLCDVHLWRFYNNGDPLKLTGHKVHGQTGTPEHLAWTHIVQRCTNPNTKGFHNYGGRGIKICDEWRNSFAAFFAYIGPRPSSNHSIDRINNDGNYEPGNVRWATQKDQCRNMRRNVHATYKGRTMCLADWAEVLGVDRSGLLYHHRNGTFPGPRGKQRAEMLGL